MILNNKTKRNINIIQKNNSKEFTLLENIVERHINNNHKKQKQKCLIRLFKFEIIRFYADFISKKNDNKINNNYKNSHYKLYFPNINIIKKKIKINFNFYKFQKTIDVEKKFNIKSYLIEKLSSILGNKLIVGLRPNSISIYKIIFNLIIKRYKFIFLNDEKINLNILIDQKKNLLNLFNDIETRLKFPTKLNGKKNLLKFIKLYTSRYPSKENNIDILVTGSLINTNNRIIAYNLKNKTTQIKVINIAHGHNWIWDEAYNEVPEYEYVDYYLSYGKPRPISLKIKKNLIYAPKVVASSCDIIKNIKENYSNLNIKEKNFINSKFLYVSREYQINGVLPHMFSDKVYNLWHKILLEKFKKYDLTIKLHPKAKTSIDKEFFAKNRFRNRKVSEKKDRKITSGNYCGSLDM